MEQEPRDMVNRFPDSNDCIEVIETHKPRVNGDETRDPDKKHCFLFILFTEYTYIAFAITLLMHVVMISLTAILYVYGYPILNIDFRGIPYEVRDSDIHVREKALLGFKSRDVEYFSPYINKLQFSSVDRFLMNYLFDWRTHFLDIIFEEKSDKNIYTKNNLMKLKKFENEILNDSLYICDKPNCMSYSVLRLFDGSFSDLNPIFYDPDFENVTLVLNTAFSYNGTRYFLEPLLHKNTRLNKSNFESKYTFMSYTGANRPDEKDSNYDYWLNKFHTWNEEGYKSLNLYLMSLRWYVYVSIDMIYRDIYLIIGAYIFIFLFMWFQTGSLWLSLWGIFSTLVSFITGNLLYSTVFRYRYFGIFHVLSIFIVLGIAADDIFIFCDLWKLSGLKHYNSLADRFSDCFVRAAKSMFVTSITTAAAFFTCAFTPLLVVSSFGLFSGLVVLVNYLSVIIFYPSVIVIYHLHFEKCFCRRSNSENESRHTVKAQLPFRFFSNSYHTLLKNSRVDSICLSTFVVLITLFSVFTSMIKVDMSEPNFLRSSDKREIYRNKRLNEFRALEPNSNATVLVVWGLGNVLNRTRSCGKKEYSRDCYWEWDTLFNQSFDLSSATAQSDIKEFCNYLHNLSDAQMDDLRISRSPTTGSREIYCFMDNMQDLLDMMNVTFPIDKRVIEKGLKSLDLPKLVLNHINVTKLLTRLLKMVNMSFPIKECEIKKLLKEIDFENIILNHLNVDELLSSVIEMVNLHFPIKKGDITKLLKENGLIKSNNLLNVTELLATAVEIANLFFPINENDFEEWLSKLGFYKTVVDYLNVPKLLLTGLEMLKISYPIKKSDVEKSITMIGLPGSGFNRIIVNGVVPAAMEMANVSFPIEESIIKKFLTEFLFISIRELISKALEMVNMLFPIDQNEIEKLLEETDWQINDLELLNVTELVSTSLETVNMSFPIKEGDIKKWLTRITSQRVIHDYLTKLLSTGIEIVNNFFPINATEVSKWLEVYDLPKMVFDFLNATKLLSRPFEAFYRLWSIFPVEGQQNYENLLAIDHESPPQHGERFAYVAVKIKLSVNRWLDSFSDGLDLYNKWENLVAPKIANMSPSMQGGFQTTFMTWRWFELIKVLVNQGVWGLVIGVFVAWGILVLFCGNWIVGSLAAFFIACVCVSVMGTIRILGWKFGMLESMNATLVVGLSIDYLVHIGVAYTNAEADDRSSRVQFALSEVGWPVTCGAITTLGSSIFMLFTKIQFFFQFGVFMTCTIGFAWLYCFTAFLILLEILGPQGSTGSNMYIIRKLRQVICKKKKYIVKSN